MNSSYLLHMLARVKRQSEESHSAWLALTLQERKTVVKNVQNGEEPFMAFGLQQIGTARRHCPFGDTIEVSLSR